MKKIIIIITVFILVSCKAQETELKKAVPGFDETGLLKVNMDEPLEIFADPADNEPFDEINFERIRFGEESGSLSITSSHLKGALNPYKMSGGSSTDEGKRLIRMGLGPEMPILAFRVIRSTPEYFEILINDTTKEVGYVKNRKGYLTNHFIYESWEDYLKRAVFIYIQNYDIFDSAGGNIVEKKQAGAADSYKVYEVSGDWIKVKKAEKPVWIMWRKDGQIAVTVIENTIE